MTDEIDALPAALWKHCIVTLLALLTIINSKFGEKKERPTLGLNPRP